MPRIVWRVEDASITLVDRAQWGVTLRIPEREPVPIPPLTLGVWPFSFGSRLFELRSVRNLDRLRYQLWCEGHLLPRGELDRRRAHGETCAMHPTDPALCLCTRCRRPSCKVCSPNGIHCAPCLDLLMEEDRLAAVRSRRIGIGGSIGFGVVAAGVGWLAHSPIATELGVGALVLTAFLYGRGLLAERDERRQGRSAAIDRPTDRS